MSQVPLVPGVIYHIYNRGNNGENIFPEQRNYYYFLNLYAKYIAPIAKTYAYCLLRNHFHFMVRINILEELDEPSSLERFISQQFATFFGTYTKAVNKANSRTGTLFEGRFKRKPVIDDSYFKMLVAYIHQNPQRHGLIDDYRDWPFSSYHDIISQKPTQLSRETALSWFNGSDGLIQYHEKVADFTEIKDLIDDDWL